MKTEPEEFLTYEQSEEYLMRLCSLRHAALELQKLERAEPRLVALHPEGWNELFPGWDKEVTYRNFPELVNSEYTAAVMEIEDKLTDEVFKITQDQILPGDDFEYTPTPKTKTTLF